MLLAWLTLPELDGALPSGQRWVHQQISAFGESAGAVYACLHLFARGNEGLLQRVITERAGCTNSAISPQTRAGVEAPSRDFLAQL
jgi:carboxylesterase type B